MNPTRRGWIHGFAGMLKVSDTLPATRLALGGVAAHGQWQLLQTLFGLVLASPLLGAVISASTLAAAGRVLGARRFAS